jgi:hypothetical protein
MDSVLLSAVCITESKRCTEVCMKNKILSMCTYNANTEVINICVLKLISIFVLK